MSEYHTTAQLNLYLKASSLEEAEELARRYVDQIKNISDVGGVEVTLWHVRTEEIPHGR
jgi:RNase P subunit RPR2